MFHWSIVVPISQNDVISFDAVYGLTAAGMQWHFRSQRYTLRQSPSAIVVVRIGGITAENRLSTLSEILENVPMDSAPEDADLNFDCVAWFRHAVRTLHAKGFINCSDPIALHKELQALALAQEPKTRRGKGYKYHISSVST